MFKRLKYLAAACGAAVLMSGCGGGGGGPVTEMVVSTHANGAKKEVHFYQGQKSNIVRKMNYNDAGNVLFDQFFKNINNKSEPDSTRTIYSPDGKMTRQEFYSNGQKHGSDKEWYANGQVKSQAEFANGAPVGKTTMYFEDGTLAKEVSYAEGEKHGAEIDYFPSGQKKRVKNFANGRQTGLDQEFFESGNIKEQHEYADGALNGKFIKNVEKKVGKDMKTTLVQTGSYLNGREHDTVVMYNAKTGRKEALAVYDKGVRVFGQSWAND